MKDDTRLIVWLFCFGIICVSENPIVAISIVVIIAMMLADYKKL